MAVAEVRLSEHKDLVLWLVLGLVRLLYVDKVESAVCRDGELPALVLLLDFMLGLAQLADTVALELS